MKTSFRYLRPFVLQLTISALALGVGHPAAMLVTSASIFNVNQGKILSPFTQVPAGSSSHYSEAVFRFLEAELPVGGNGEADFILDKRNAHYTGVKAKVWEGPNRLFRYQFNADSLLLKLHQLGLGLPADFRALVRREGNEKRVIYERNELVIETKCLADPADKSMPCYYAYALPVVPLSDEQKKQDLSQIQYQFSNPARSISIQIGSREEIARLAQTYLTTDGTKAGRALYESHFNSIPLRLRIFPVDPEQNEEEILKSIKGKEEPFHLPDVRGFYLTFHKTSKTGFILKPTSKDVNVDSMDHLIDSAAAPATAVDGLDPALRGVVTVGSVYESSPEKGTANYDVEATAFLQTLALPAIQGISKHQDAMKLDCIIPASGRDSGRACLKKDYNGKVTTVITGMLPITAETATSEKSIASFFVRSGYDLYLLRLDRDPNPIVPVAKNGAVTVVPAGEKGLSVGPLPPPGK